jgi:hypothetical protein
VENELGWTGWDEVVSQSEAFWAAALSFSCRKVAWFSKRSAMEYAGFLQWLWRLRDTPCEIIDLTDVKIFRDREDGPSKPCFAQSLGIVPFQQIVDNDLLGRAEFLEKKQRNDYRSSWQQLRDENAPFRVLDGRRLVSAPMTFFDTSLMSFVTDNWRKVAFVVAHALHSQMDDGISQTGDLVLAARVQALVETGQLELQGTSALEMRSSEVRLPQNGRRRENSVRI